MHREPVAPHLLRADIPSDLEYICLKCLEKAPGERYATMSDLAGDLDCFLEGKTIARRVLSAPQRLVYECRRNPATAARLTCLGLFFTIEQVWRLVFGITTRNFYLVASVSDGSYTKGRFVESAR